MSMLSKLPGVAGIWEPLHEDRGVVPDRWGARPHRDAMTAQDKALLADVLAGNLVNAWTCSRTPLRDAVGADQLLVKYVRGNSLLPLVLDEWNLQHKPILLMRHPWDVVQSQVRAFGPRPVDVDVDKVYPGHSLLQTHWAEVRAETDPLKRQLHIWCLLNAPLWERYAQNPDVIALHYHDLVLDPESQLVSTLNQLEWTPANRSSWNVRSFVEGLDSRATSDTDFRGDRLANQRDQLWKNLKALTPSRRRELQQVLDRHGLTMYSMEEPNPRVR